jgi:enoyl-[acyl-carrier protein] reductase I
MSRRFNRATITSGMSNLLEGKNALITGVSNKWSIAYAIAQAFVREGAHVILTYQGERLKQTVEDLAHGLKIEELLSCDVTQEADLEQLTQHLKATQLHAVVHAIAFANREDLARPFSETSREGFLLAQEVSAFSLVSLARATRSALNPADQGGASLMTLSYLGAVRVVQNYNVMGVAKAALESTVRYLAADLGASNIRVNAISAGPIKTTSARGIRNFTKVLEGTVNLNPLRRNTDPAEVADTAVFLASDLGRGVTGNILYVDAGFQIMGLALPE